MYHPAMSDENVHRLYRLKLQRKKPMTRLLDEILDEFFRKNPLEGQPERSPDEGKDDE